MNNRLTSINSYITNAEKKLAKAKRIQRKLKYKLASPEMKARYDKNNKYLDMLFEKNWMVRTYLADEREKEGD